MTHVHNTMVPLTPLVARLVSPSRVFRSMTPVAITLPDKTGSATIIYNDRRI